jgi:hypothetical protein
MAEWTWQSSEYGVHVIDFKRDGTAAAEMSFLIGVAVPNLATFCGEVTALLNKHEAMKP